MYSYTLNLKKFDELNDTDTFNIIDSLKYLLFSVRWICSERISIKTNWLNYNMLPYLVEYCY